MKKEENKIFNKKNVIGLIIIIIMVSSVLGVWQGSATALDKYNNFKFKADEQAIYGKIKDKWVQFQYHPKDLESINASSDAMQKLNDSKMLYITFNPDDKLIGYVDLMRMELAKSLMDDFMVYPIIGSSSNSTDYQNFPIIDCGNATRYIPVVYLEAGNETKITIDAMENDCVHIYAERGMDFTPLFDRIRYTLYGVMN